MTRALITIVLWLLLSGFAHAETVERMKDPPANMPGATLQRKVCYYEADGFIYHYVIGRGLMVTRPCENSIETPFAPVPTGWAVLVKDELEAHDRPSRLCYYGLAHRRLEVERISPHQSCRWTAGREYVPPTPATGMAVLAHEEDATTGTNTKLCFYRLSNAIAPGRFTHYMTLSKYSKCPDSFPVP